MGKLLQITGARIVVIIGCIFIGIGTYLQTAITVDYTLNELLFSQILKGIGAQFLWIGNQYLSLSAFSVNAIYNAAAIFNLVLRLAAAVSIAFASSLLTKWKAIFLNYFENGMNSRIDLNLRYFNDMNIENFQENKLLFFLFSERESLIMALNKISFFSAWTALLPIILMLYIKTNKKIFFINYYCLN